MPHFKLSRINAINPICWDTEPYWTFMGAFYGFPPCCINEFCTIHYSKRQLNENHPAYGTGYVPCNNCKTQISSMQSFRKFIESNIEPYRFMKRHFPADMVYSITEFDPLLKMIKPLISETSFTQIVDCLTDNWS